MCMQVLLTGEHTCQTSTYLPKVQKMYIKCIRNGQECVEGQKEEMDTQYCQRELRGFGSSAVTRTSWPYAPVPIEVETTNSNSQVFVLVCSMYIVS